MTPPGAPAAGDTARAADAPPAVSVCLHVLRNRSEFLKAAKSVRTSTPGFVLQARKRRADETRTGIGIGFTCTKKVGNAVVRNRAKRRLREIARIILPEHGRAGWDYVLIGRANVTAKHPINDMCSDLKSALPRLHQAQS